VQLAALRAGRVVADLRPVQGLAGDEAPPPGDDQAALQGRLDRLLVERAARTLTLAAARPLSPLTACAPGESSPGESLSPGDSLSPAATGAAVAVALAAATLRGMSAEAAGAALAAEAAVAALAAETLGMGEVAAPGPLVRST
jgi:hypothetical protein